MAKLQASKNAGIVLLEYQSPQSRERFPTLGQTLLLLNWRPHFICRRTICRCLYSGYKVTESRITGHRNKSEAWGLIPGAIRGAFIAMDYASSNQS